MSYAAPLKDTLFSLIDVLDMPSHYQAVAPSTGLDAQTLAAVLEAVGQFAEGELAPLNASGDAEGAQCVHGQVTAPKGFAQAYQRYVEAGWPGLAQQERWGGQGLPYSVQMAAGEYLQGANQAWSMYAMLNDGAIKTLLAGARPDLLERFLPRLVSGEWLSTMCLTEPQAGSDLGLLHARAEPVGDPAQGRYRITGNKMFISSGDHDWTSNIVHLVLARLPDAPSGVRGISLFLVPKFGVAEDGALLERNAVHCLSVEHKMGLKGSATCAMAFDGAEGWLVGEPHRGLANMFVFINKSRLGVAMQAVAQAQAAYQNSLAYARERLQGRSPLVVAGQQAADPLVMQPDVRRMLLTQKAIAEGGRTLVHYCAKWVDRVDLGDETARQQAERMLGLLTPIAKAFLSELAFESVDAGLQVFGGHGYTKEWDVEQRLRDVRVTRIYEGTTGIQGMDLLGRKVLADPDLLPLLTDEILDWCERTAVAECLAPWVAEVVNAVSDWCTVTESLRQRARQDPALISALGVDYLMYSGYVLLGYMWLQQAHAAQLKGSVQSTGKQVTADFYFRRLMPRRQLHLRLLSDEQACMTASDLAVFGE